MTKGSIARPNRPMSARKAKLEAERRAYLEAWAKETAPRPAKPQGSSK